MNRIFARPLAAVLLFCLWASATLAQPLEEKVREHTFPNGLKLLVVERRESPTIAAYITIGVGSVHETSRQRGVAHLLEHMLFKGTRELGTTDYRKEKPLLEEIEKVGSAIDRLKNRPDADPRRLAELRRRMTELEQEHKKYVVKDEFSRIYAENGGVGYNAFTSKDLTTYLISLPANKLELWAAIESDRMKNAVLREFYTEREVVREERRRSYDSNPDGMLYENLIANAFTVHPYRNPIIGWDSDIANLSLEETRDFLKSYYAPVNTVIALVGDLEFEAAVEMVERYFGEIPPGEPVPPVVGAEPPQKGEKRFHIQFDAEPQISIAYHKPTLPERDDYIFDLIDQILSQGRTSRLYRALVVEKELATSIGTFGAPGARFSNLFVISAVPRYPHTTREVEEAVYAELDRLGREPVSQAELEQARNRLRVDQLRNLQGNSGLARMLTYYQTIAGDWRYLVTYDRQLESITAEEVAKAARTYFRPANRIVGTIGKEGAK